MFAPILPRPTMPNCIDISFIEGRTQGNSLRHEELPVDERYVSEMSPSKTADPSTTPLAMKLREASLRMTSHEVTNCYCVIWIIISRPLGRVTFYGPRN